MLIALWIINGLLALAFLGAGLMKLARPAEALASSGMGWAADFASSHVKLIGLAEVLGAIGLILPLLLDVAPVLTPIAAILLAVLMLGAVVVHLRRKESPAAPIVLAILSIVSAILGFAAL
ncbi:DoxX family protein [Curtobacterium sp. MCJR17_055]|uniref:DoxX family protein n=1 Tax=unclassified Curtobacterium TaxID=257496 RepID=UPI000D8653FE|nr:MULTISPECIES: DoxX family protein [unclassified Curtobacterium]PYY37880.1 DoxX family protein [Curtobacterium sp. MCBD17_029]PYY51806.1 DoxX family protein [Curtobacterium sp. MCBD17_023]PYY56907.1 DoxX family protein [Curtobacterium sp. MCJR17_055]PYY62178.1 DoxX family protein [Curtobacterium sp. MCPF17_015]PZE87047.1 DoxX family protein [Curtobacterium sp. MCBD17_032]